MSIARAKGARRRRGFTLLEITLAVVILAMMSLAIYRFVQSNLTAVRVSSQENAIDAEYDGFLALLTTEFQDLPGGEGALFGEPLKLEDRPRDELTWVCGAGPGLLTRYAAGDFQVSLRIRPVPNTKNAMEIGVLRKPTNSGIASEDETWIPLLEGVQSLEIKYFDPRLNSWVNRWTDTVTLPRLVRLVIERTGNAVPWDAIVPLARTPL